MIFSVTKVEIDRVTDVDRIEPSSNGWLLAYGSDGKLMAYISPLGVIVRRVE